MSESPARVNPLDLGDFSTKAIEQKSVIKEAVAAVADAHGFPSRQAAKPKAEKPMITPKKEDRRSQRRTGRDRQVNVRMTPATYEKMDRMSRERGNMAFGELVRIALVALENSER